MGSAVMLGLTAVGAIGQGIIQYRNSKAQAAALEFQAHAAKNQYDAQARISEQNEGRARNEAEAAARAGAVEQRQMRNRIRAIQSEQAARYGASGLSLASGTPMSALVSTEVEGEEDVRRQGLNTAMKRLGLVNQAQDYNTNARLQRQAGENQFNTLMNQASAARSAGRNALTGSIFSAVESIATGWGGGAAKAAMPKAPTPNYLSDDIFFVVDNRKRDPWWRTIQ